jgi:hypothetical protein
MPDDDTSTSTDPAAQYRDQAAHLALLATTATTARARSRSHVLDTARLCEALADGTGLVRRQGF